MARDDRRCGSRRVSLGRFAVCPGGRIACRKILAPAEQTPRKSGDETSPTASEEFAIAAPPRLALRHFVFECGGASQSLVDIFPVRHFFMSSHFPSDRKMMDRKMILGKPVPPSWRVGPGLGRKLMERQQFWQRPSAARALQHARGNSSADSLGRGLLSFAEIGLQSIRLQAHSRFWRRPGCFQGPGKPHAGGFVTGRRLDG